MGTPPPPQFLSKLFNAFYTNRQLGMVFQIVSYLLKVPDFEDKNLCKICFQRFQRGESFPPLTVSILSIPGDFSTSSTSSSSSSSSIIIITVMMIWYQSWCPLARTIPTSGTELSPSPPQMGQAIHPYHHHQNEKIVLYKPSQ